MNASSLLHKVGAIALAGSLSLASAQVIEPTRAASVTPYGVPGMANVTSAAPVGAGRANLQLRGNYFEQSRSFPGAMPSGSGITTVSGGLALGLNDYLDAFGVLNIYNLRATGSGDGSGFGSSILGAQMAIPFSKDAPIKVGVQLAALFGTAGNQLNTNGLDGYNYLETRTSTDVMARAMQSLLMAKNGTGFNLHLNEGIISSFQPGKDIALVTGAGVEFIPMISMILGLEVNSRTFLNNVTSTDPLWVTPSVTWRTPVFVNINVGADIALSKDRGGSSVRALEPWRGFAGLTYSIDTRAESKRRAREAARQDSLERAALANQARTSDAEARLAQQRADSTAAAAAAADALARSKADSLAMKAKADSLEMARRLAEEQSKRSDMEKQLLTTGLLVMDAVYFETGKTDISINSEPYLTLIAKMLVKYPKLQIEIGGHTDNVGGLTYNKKLSEGRSAAVVAYMVRVAPELSGRLTSKGYAYSQPKATNSTPAGRQLNRRTELKVLNRAALEEYR
jgi:outer membrane protein OmpA-like peptidoglycan-associated protein